MSRFLLALCLSLCAVAAFAKAPAGNEECPGAAAKAEKTVNGTVNNAPDGDAATPNHAPIVPLHSSSAPHMTSPRWHSLLPGMIR